MTDKKVIVVGQHDPTKMPIEGVLVTEVRNIVWPVDAEECYHEFIALLQDAVDLGVGVLFQDHQPTVVVAAMLRWAIQKAISQQTGVELAPDADIGMIALKQSNPVVTKTQYEFEHEYDALIGLRLAEDANPNARLILKPRGMTIEMERSHIAQEFHEIIWIEELLG